MDYLPLILAKLQELRKLSPDLSFGDILYSILRKGMLKNTPDDAKISWLRDISNFEFYNSISRLMKEEEQFKTNDELC